MSELEHRAAEMPCPDPECKKGKVPYFMEGAGWGTIAHDEANGCQGTGRLWPGLSRECPCIYGDYDRHECWWCYRSGQHELGKGTGWKDGPPTCTWCHGSGRVPEVTLEKVLGEILKDTPGQPMRLHGLIVGGFELWRSTDGPFRAETLLEAALAALLASGEGGLMGFKGIWQINRYCFQSKAVEKFFYCDNCGKYFCIPHHKHDLEYGPYHEDCL